MMNDPMIPMIVLVLVIFIAYQWFGRFIFNYTTDEIGITIYLFRHFAILKIKYVNIDEIQIVPLSDLRQYLAFKFIDCFLGKQIVLIVRNDSILFKYIVITPDDPDNFVFEVTKKKASPEEEELCR